MGDPDWHDPKMAGWWMWGQSSWIGSGWCSGDGPLIVGDDGRIVKRAKGEEGVWCQRPHLANNGQGVNHANTREEGVRRKLPHLGDDGKGVNHAGTREEGVAYESEYHPITMPELRRWMQFLSARLRHVRILNGSWERLCTGGATKSLAVRMGGGHCGVFLDPPYADTAERDANVYAHDSLSVAHDVRAWCVKNGPDPKLRIVLAGFDGEHNELESLGWRSVEWYRAGFLKGGMGNTATGGSTTQQVKERLWLSPHCLSPRLALQSSLF
jgi:hypothetical protein